MTEQRMNPGQLASMQAAVMKLAERPQWVQDGEWSWRSYTAGDFADHTVIMVSTPRGTFQFLIQLEWAEFGSREECEELASYIVKGMVLHRNHPTYRHAKRFGLVTEVGGKVTFYFERAE